MICFNNNFIIYSICIIIISFSAPQRCTAEICEGSPFAILKKYYSRLSEGSIEKAYEFLTKEDKKNISKKQFLKNNYREILILTNKSTTLYLLKTTFEANEAICSVKLIIPDIGELYGFNLGLSIGSFEGTDFNIKNINEKVISDLKNQNFEYKEIINEFKFLCEDGVWKIFLDINREIKIRNIILKALKHSSEGDYEAAKELFKEVLDIDKNNQIAITGIKRIEIGRNGE